MPTHDQYDIIVIGAGPAGCAAAAVAARHGLTTLLLERDSEPRFKIGESLMPETYWAFERMGALESMKNSEFVPKHSVQFYARSGKASAPFYFREERDHESAQTWQVLRSSFDQLLLENSAEQGAECRRGAAVKEILFDGEQVTGVEVELEGSQRSRLGCRVLIDASGQSTLLGRRFDLGKVDYGFRHASIFTHYKGARRDQGRDEGATLILQTVPDGNSWFWYIPLPDDVVSVGVVGDAQYLKRPGNSPEDTFLEEVEKCPEIRERISHGERCRPIEVLRDFSYRFERMAGDGWQLIGDAFSFIDPVYSSGVFLALHSGVMAADAAAHSIAVGDLSAQSLGAFEPRLRRAIAPILGLVRAFYEPEFSFGRFLKEFPQHQTSVTRILIGDVFEYDFDPMFRDMAQMLGHEVAVTT